ncbi:hypothetical protein KL86PLE_10091 [uncultured Pleomorphomonas sp.]|uniref:Uncharacterized protein n=1 Tax=uncultured Pleomorphomonas sp. TaxID=442121 RepID=A0A212KY87_9HYPH|nr:hypothetical protein KL86PLE_10091 [uncultured Pleomorphomonas sp.]
MSQSVSPVACDRREGLGTTEEFAKEFPYGAGFTAAAARSCRRTRLRHAGLQHQQHGADAVRHGRGQGDRQPGDHAGQPRRPRVRQRHRAQPPDQGGHRALSRHPGLHAPGPRQLRGHLPFGHHQRLLVGNDGRLAQGRRQDPGRLRIQRRRHRPRCRAQPHGRRLHRGRTRRARLAGDRHGRQGRRPWRRGRPLQGAAPDRSRRGREVRQAHQGRRPGHRHGHQPRRLQVHAQAGRRSARHLPHQGNPRAHAERAPRHARLVVGSRGAARAHQPLWRRDARDLWRAGRGNRQRHQARRPQGQHRHRLPHGHHRRNSPVLRREAGRIRSAFVHEAGDGRDAEGLQGALRGLRRRRSRLEDQADPARRHGQALRFGRTRSQDRLTGSPPITKTGRFGAPFAFEGIGPSGSASRASDRKVDSGFRKIRCDDKELDRHLASARTHDDLGDRIDCRLPNQEADNAVLGIRGGDPDADFAPAGAKADASADADQAGEVLLDVGFAFDRQAAVAPEAGPDAADDWNGRQALEFQMGGKSLLRRYNHGSFLLQGDGRHDG